MGDLYYITIIVILLFMFVFVSRVLFSIVYMKSPVFAEPRGDAWGDEAKTGELGDANGLLSADELKVAYGDDAKTAPLGIVP